MLHTQTISHVHLLCLQNRSRTNSHRTHLARAHPLFPTAASSPSPSVFSLLSSHSQVGACKHLTSLPSSGPGSWKEPKFSRSAEGLGSFTKPSQYTCQANSCPKAFLLAVSLSVELFPQCPAAPCLTPFRLLLECFLIAGPHPACFHHLHHIN